LFVVAGIEWAVFDVLPDLALRVDPALTGGWLCFESGDERRRLHPIPPQWEECSEEHLRELLAIAPHSSGKSGLLMK